jgi:class 3 adenylate cyclase
MKSILKRASAHKFRLAGAVALALSSVLCGNLLIPKPNEGLKYSDLDASYFQWTQKIGKTNRKLSDRLQLVLIADPTSKDFWNEQSSLKSWTEFLNSVAPAKPAAVVIGRTPTGPFSQLDIKSFMFEANALKIPVVFGVRRSEPISKSKSNSVADYPDLNLLAQIAGKYPIEKATVEPIPRDLVAIGGAESDKSWFTPSMTLPNLGLKSHLAIQAHKFAVTRKTKSSSITDKLGTMTSALPHPPLLPMSTIESRLIKLNGWDGENKRISDPIRKDALILVDSDLDSLRQTGGILNALLQNPAQLIPYDATSSAVWFIAISFVLFYTVPLMRSPLRISALLGLVAFLVSLSPVFLASVFVGIIPVLVSLSVLVAGLLLQRSVVRFVRVAAQTPDQPAPSDNAPAEFMDMLGRVDFKHFEGGGTILFVGGMGIEEIPEKYTAAEFFHELSVFETALIRLIRDEKAIVSGNIVGGITAFFGYPYSEGADKFHADRALECGKRIQMAVVNHITSLEQSDKPAFPIRIGIDSGQISLGNLAANNSLELAILGPAVEGAKVLHVACSAFSILLSATTRDLLILGEGKNVPAEQKLVQVRGRSALLTAYEYDPLKDQPDTRHQAFEVLRNGMRRQVARKRWNVIDSAQIIITANGSHAVASNFSKGGLAIVCSQKQPVGGTVEVTFDSSDGSLKKQLSQHKIVTVKLEVRWVKQVGAKFFHGCRYTGMTDENLSYLLTCLTSAQISASGAA